MFTTLLAKELMDHFKSLRFVTGWIAVLLLSLTSVYLISSDYNQKDENYRIAGLMQEEAVAEYGHLNRISYFVSPLRPVTKSEMLFRGLNDKREESYFFVDVLNKAYPAFDMVFIITTLLSLLAIIFTYDGVCGERETGTLKLLHTTRVARWQVLLAKWSGAVVSIALPTAFVFLLAALFGSLFTGVETDLAFLGTLGLIYLATCLYVGFFAALGLFVSTIVRHSGSSILVLLFLWVIFVLVLPNASPIIASQVEPLPSIASVEDEANRVRNRERDDRIVSEMKTFLQQFLTKNNVAPPEAENPFDKIEELMDVSFYQQQGFSLERARKLQKEFSEPFMALVTRINEEQTEKAQQVRAELERKAERQRRLAVILSYFSPTASMTFFATDMASLGIRSEDYFDESAERYINEFWEWANQRSETISEELGVQIGYNDKIDLSGWPRFTYVPEPVSERLYHAGFNLAHMCVFMLLALVAGVVTYQRYDIR